MTYPWHITHNPCIEDTETSHFSHLFPTFSSHIGPKYRYWRQALTYTSRGHIVTRMETTWHPLFHNMQNHAILLAEGGYLWSVGSRGPFFFFTQNILGKFKLKYLHFLSHKCVEISRWVVDGCFVCQNKHCHQKNSRKSKDISLSHKCVIISLWVADGCPPEAAESADPFHLRLSPFILIGMRIFCIIF